MKVLLLGGYGMAGHMILRYLSSHSNYELYCTYRTPYLNHPLPISEAHGFPVDVTKFDAVRTVCQKLQPDIVMNCTGVLNQEAEQNPELAMLVNGYLPHYLSYRGKQQKFRLIHLSTDCVFSGTRGGYSETDQPDGTSHYAKTKQAGEVHSSPHLTIRTSIIGPELKNKGIGLFQWFMKQSGTIFGYTNVYWTGVTTLELAKGIHAAIESDLSGLVHLVPDLKISKYDLLRLIKDTFSKQDVEILPQDHPVVDKSLIVTRTDFPHQTLDYPDQIQELYSFIKGGHDHV